MGENGHAVRPDLIRRVTVGRDAVRAHNHGLDLALLHEMSRHVIGDEGHWDAVFGEFPGCQARPLKERPGLIREYLNILPL